MEITNPIYDVMFDTNLVMLKVALEKALPISVNIDDNNKRYTGYITELDTKEKTFELEMPGDQVIREEIIKVWKINLDIFSSLNIRAGERYKIWLDDLLEAPVGYIGARSVNEVIKIIELIERRDGQIELLDLDSNLGSFEKFGGDSSELLVYLREKCRDYTIYIHNS